MSAKPKHLLVCAAAAATIALAGCGGSGETTSSTIDAAALQQFQSCLSEHGVELPQGGAPPGGGAPPSGGQPPSGGGFPRQGGAPSKKVQRAMEACQQYAPQGPPGGFPGAPIQ